MTKILAIDDSKTMRLAIKITFASEGAEVVAVSKGSEAVARAQQMPADVLIVDHTLASGEPSGLEVARAIKTNPATAHVPVILMMSMKAPIPQPQLAEAGVDATIVKPFDTQELIDKVASVRAAGASKPAPSVAPAPAAPSSQGLPPQSKVAAAATVAATPVASAAPRPVTAVAPASAPRPAPAAPVAAAARPSAPPPAAAPSPGVAASVAAAPASAPRPPSGPQSASGPIPIAVSIPFAPANAPTPGMLQRLAQASAGGGAAAGLDPTAVKALLALSREVVEQVVWEVVPELAEQIIREKAARGPDA